MAAEPIEIGETGRRVAANLAIIRRRRNLSYIKLAERLIGAGRPIPGIGLRRIENLERRVDVDDLTALAAVFGMEPHQLAYEAACGQCGGDPPEGFTCNQCGAPNYEQHARKVRQTRRIVTPTLLREVATVYRSELDAGRPPTVGVATHFSTSHTSAARWVREARKAGILGPSRGTRAGEAVS